MVKLKGERRGAGGGLITDDTEGVDAYLKMAKESEGFDVNSAGSYLCGGIALMKISKRVIEVAKAAVDLYNISQNEDEKLIFKSVVKANGQVVSFFMYYITLRARSPNSKRSKVYQAKVYDPTSGDLQLQIFRERPKRPTEPRPRRKLLEKRKAKLGPTPNHLEIKEKKAKPLSLPKGAFFTFMSDLRKHPDLHNKMKHSDVPRLASMIWRSMSAEGKMRQCWTRSLGSKDIAACMKALL